MCCLYLYSCHWFFTGLVATWRQTVGSLQNHKQAAGVCCHPPSAKTPCLTHQAIKYPLRPVLCAYKGRNLVRRCPYHLPVCCIRDIWCIVCLLCSLCACDLSCLQNLPPWLNHRTPATLPCRVRHLIRYMNSHTLTHTRRCGWCVYIFL